MLILPPRGPARDVDIALVFSGPVEAFIATKHLQYTLQIPKRKQLGLDVNRRGKYALVSSLNTPIPAEIDKLNERWT